MTREQMIIDTCLRRMGFGATEMRGSDSLDFCDISVATARRELEIAFAQGYEEGLQPENAPVAD